VSEDFFGHSGQSLSNGRGMGAREVESLERNEKRTLDTLLLSGCQLKAVWLTCILPGKLTGSIEASISTGSSDSTALPWAQQTTHPYAFGLLWGSTEGIIVIVNLCCDGRLATRCGEPVQRRW